MAAGAEGDREARRPREPVAGLVVGERTRPVRDVVTAARCAEVVVRDVSVFDEVVASCAEVFVVNLARRVLVAIIVHVRPRRAG